MRTRTRIVAVLLVSSVCASVILPTFSAPIRARMVALMRHSVRHKPNAAMVRAKVTALALAPTVGFGSPLPDLTGEQLTAFAIGLDEFVNVENPAGGLGPVFNNNSCVSCHGVPAVGGASNINVTRFGAHPQGGSFDPLVSLGGSLLQQRAIVPAALEVVPTAANVVALRQSTPLFGMGLIEAIPDSAILDNAARQQSSEISGRPSLVNDTATGLLRIGRFGWKAQIANLLTFSGDAYLNEMGITNRFFPTENAPNGDLRRLAQFDTVLDPEDTVDPLTGRSDIDAAADFMRYLAPPPVALLTPSATQGAAVFGQTGCTGCHTPQFRTGADDARIRSRYSRTVNLYSDLLLHDMGALGDGIVQGTASETEMKTPPLWGLSASAPYLHDGRARSVDQAILAHDGEAAATRERYRALTPTLRQQLLDFLNSI